MTDRWDLVDGTVLTSIEGHRLIINGMAGPFLKLDDAGSEPPLPDEFACIGIAALIDHIDSGRWSIVDNEPST